MTIAMVIKEVYRYNLKQVNGGASGSSQYVPIIVRDINVANVSVCGMR